MCTLTLYGNLELLEVDHELFSDTSESCFIVCIDRLSCGKCRKPYVRGGAFGYVQVGQIYQKFECKGRSDGGIVRNVVRWSIENLLEVNLYDNCASMCPFLEVLSFNLTLRHNRSCLVFAKKLVVIFFCWCCRLCLELRMYMLHVFVS